MSLSVAGRRARSLYARDLPNRSAWKTTLMHSDGTISVRVNGEHRRIRDGLTLSQLASELGLEPTKVAVERNLEVVPRSTLGDVRVEDGDELEIVHFVGGGDHAAPVIDDTWTV